MTTTNLRFTSAATDAGISISVDLERLVAAVREAASERPDFVYPVGLGGREGCHYVHDGKPDCLIGVGLDRCGIDLTPLAEAGSIATDGDTLAVDWLWRVQFEQDGGATWADAIKTADEVHPLPV